MVTLKTLRPIVENSRVIRHPFLEEFRMGRLSRSQLRIWLSQQYWLSVSLPRCFATLYARVSDKLWQVKRPLADLLHIEAWGSTAPGCHSGYFRQLASYLDWEIDALNGQPPRFYTKTFVESRFRSANTGPLMRSVAAIALGNEIMNLGIFAAYRAGADQSLVLRDGPKAYFDAHLSDEENDFNVFDRLFQALAKSKFDLHEARLAVEDSLQHRTRFFDFLLRDLEGK